MSRFPDAKRLQHEVLPPEPFSVRTKEPFMIGRIAIENYKSIESLTLDLGRVTVLIDANGSGKSNILEAIVLCSAAATKLDNEFSSCG